MLWWPGYKWTGHRVNSSQKWTRHSEVVTGWSRHTVNSSHAWCPKLSWNVWMKVKYFGSTSCGRSWQVGIVFIISSSSYVVDEPGQRRGIRGRNAQYTEQRAMSWSDHWTHPSATARVHRESVECRGPDRDASTWYQPRAQLCRIQGYQAVSKCVALRRTWHRILRVQGV